MSDITLLWLTNNLRLDDNPALLRAAQSERLICVYLMEPEWFRANRYSLRSLGTLRRSFLEQSLTDLDNRLSALGQRLQVIYERPLDALSEIIRSQRVTRLISSQHVGWYEQHTWRETLSRFPHLKAELIPTHTLFDETELPFATADLPASFSAFRRKIEKQPIQAPRPAPGSLPPPVQVPQSLYKLPNTTDKLAFTPGETGGEAQLARYFSGDLPASYKETRNGLDGWDFSTKFSPWLANGTLSARRIIQRLEQYESERIANESTYWIRFELLWREYFQWYAAKWGVGLYRFRGPFNRSPLTSFYPERFKAWCSGTTPYPIINACMNQLNATGFMSNRGRQLVASCFVHELGLDWRYGAAYFEQQLLDYDPASNWGNWQYLAGVGADPRGHRRFDLEKQTRTYDPDGVFIKHWHGTEQVQPLPNRDYYDWPV